MIHTKVEAARGCGYRKKGGIYLVSDGIGLPCCKLPFELTICPCCNEGIKQARGFTWVSSNLFSGIDCALNTSCPMNLKDEKVGLLWVGEKFYPTAAHFTKEAESRGVSKRLAQVPKDLKIGETWVYLAHPKAVQRTNEKGEPEFFKGIFRAFKPQRIEYIVTGKETPEELEKLEARGFTLIDVVRDTDQQTTM